MDLANVSTQRTVGQFFGVAQQEIGDWQNGEVVTEGTVEVRDHLRGANSGIRIGALLAMADQVGGLAGGLAALPDGWVVSTNLSIRSATLEHRGPLRLRADVLRRGRAAVVNRVQVHDDGADGRFVADAVLTSAVLVPEAGPPQWERPMAMRPPTAPQKQPPLDEWLGLRDTGEATVTMDLRDELRNPWGILHGSVISSLVDAAAVRAVGAVVGGPVAVTDIVLHFLSPGRVGPVAATVALAGARADGHVARVEVRDHGADHRLMSVAMVTVRPLA